MTNKTYSLRALADRIQEENNLPINSDALRKRIMVLINNKQLYIKHHKINGKRAFYWKEQEYKEIEKQVLESIKANILNIRIIGLD